MYLVTGATGNAGREVVAALLRLGEGVRALVRPGREDALPDGAEAVRGDLGDPASFASALAGVRGIFLLSGYAGEEETLAAAQRAGVERVVLLSSSAAPTGDLGNAVARYHLESERAVRESGLAWAFLQPNSFMSNALRWKPQLDAGDVVRGPWAGVPIATIDPADVGAVAATALVSGKEDGHALRLTGPEALTPAEQVNALGRAIGRPLHFEAQSDEDARADMLGAGVPEPYVDAFFAFFSEGTVDETTVQPTVREVLGRPAGAFDDWAIAHAAAFR